MTSLNISLPEALKDYIEGQVNSGDWSTPSEYIRELIRQDQGAAAAASRAGSPCRGEQREDRNSGR